ncbi:MAG: MBL fold metallo-hydrolase [Lachnospiraceae bacterium]|jgi:flavorubredoxin/flavin reductase (DIM6/NTAB) family NADH-FMN oxidoreductase RutF|nr:MBL fold metallo-hydrolase [Lachnospiraceae bacterium]RKJ49701.1 MBL fold metallo-hydrolase [bacterium 1XD42-54]
MYCYRKVTEDLFWVGSNDRRLAMFEGVYSVPGGVSYNSYLLIDEKTVLFDTVDKAVKGIFFENIAEVLGDRKLDYLVVHHMEPDHSEAIQELVMRYPDIQIICNQKIASMIKQYFDFDIDSRAILMKEGDSFSTGKHNLVFVMAPMVHWPEVMVSYDTTDKILFSADGFGTFGALNGALFADEVNFERDYLDEARRYYTNIVGKYGDQVQTLLKKASALEIEMICPLHGFVWRKNISDFIGKYMHWSSYAPEEYGVMIAYASVYGHTENTAEILACKLRERGVKTVMFDVSVTPASDIIAAAFKWSHLVFASTTYNAGIFVNMEALIYDLVAHNIQNRTIALIENGSWAPTSGRLMREEFEKCKNMTILDNTVKILSSLKREQLAELDALTDALTESIPGSAKAQMATKEKKEIIQEKAEVDPTAMFKLSYGLFVLSAKDGDKDNGCITNTVMQVTDVKKRIAIAVNKANYTHDMIMKTGAFNVSVLTTEAPFKLFKQFGFQSGRDVDKFADGGVQARTANGISYVPEYSNAVISGKVVETQEYDTHTLFIAEVTEAAVLSNVPSVTYQYYFDHIKPQPQPTTEKSGYVCKICGYIYEGEELPADFICPLCKHGAEDFEKL